MGSDGDQAFQTLRAQAARDGDLPKVKETFQAVWGIDLPL